MNKNKSIRISSALALLMSALILFSGCGLISEGNKPALTEAKTESPDTATDTAADTVTESESEASSAPQTTAASVSDIPETGAQDDKENILSGMTLEEKVGQMFFARCPRYSQTDIIEKYHPGGFILFSSNFKDKSKEQVTEEIKSFQNAAKITMLIGTDEEGGSVVRASKYSSLYQSPFKSPQYLYNHGGFDKIAEDTKEKSEFLLSLGINVNFAPVCDVSSDPDDYIYYRSFGKDADLTSEYVTTVVREMKKSGIGCVLKHFPGYGNNEDTHTGVAHDKRDYNTFLTSDFLPFEAGIKAGAGCVLVSHNIVECIDKEHPASLSAEVHKILRDELSYDGVIITDDISMDAIKMYTGAKEAAVAAVLAGNDMICCTDYDTQIPAVIAAVKDGTIAEEQINESVKRILGWKKSLGLTDD